MSCLDDHTVLRFIAGRLDEVAHSRVDEELARCGHCAGLVAELLRAGATAHTEPGEDDPGSEGVARAAPLVVDLGAVAFNCTGSCIDTGETRCVATTIADRSGSRHAGGCRVAWCG
jgi:hypothetical protein